MRRAGTMRTRSSVPPAVNPQQRPAPRPPPVLGGQHQLFADHFGKVGDVVACLLQMMSVAFHGSAVDLRSTRCDSESGKITDRTSYVQLSAMIRREERPVRETLSDVVVNHFFQVLKQH